MGNKNDIEKGSQRVYEIIKESGLFLTLKEIYQIYNDKFWRYDTLDESHKSIIRRFIYKRCLDRDIRDESREPLFFSLSPKKTKGNQIGIIEWLGKISTFEEVDAKDVDEIIDHVPKKPQFDDDEVIKADDLYKEVNLRKIVRSKLVMIKALNNADYNCEVNCNHPSFLRKKNKRNYTEAHHLIPLKFQKDFEYLLDTPANVISLCSNCHNQLHYGLYKKEILRCLYKQRKELLRKAKIEISFEKLCEYYNVEE